VLVAGLCLLLLPAQASAQNPAAAEALFEQARAAMAAGSYDIACARFRDSDRLDPAVGTRFNLADCEEKRGRLATAWSLFRGVSSELAQDDDRKPIADERAAKLKPRLPIVTMVLPPDAAPGMRVRIDGVEIGEASFGVPLPMDPGKHDLSLLPAGGPERRRSFVLREGEHSELLLAVGDAPEPQPPRGAAEPASEAGETDDSRRRWAYVAGGVGIAGVVVGAAAGIMTLQKKSVADGECDDATRTCSRLGRDANESGRRFGVLSSVGFGIGVVGLAAGTYLFLTSPSSSAASTYRSTPRRSETAAAKLRAELALEPESGFVSLAGRF
jgi:hypothetical protein